MREPEWSVDRLKDEIAVLGTRGLSRQDYFAELAPRLRRTIGSDASCWHTLDPQTRLLTSDEPRELVEAGVYTAETVAAAGEVLVRSEYLEKDRNTFAELASRRVPVGILAQATRGNPERSVRYRELLEPSGIPHELRAAFVRRGRVWGAVHIARREASGAFTQRDADVLAQVVPTIAEGIRGSLRFDAARRVGGAEAPGLVVLDGAGEVDLITPPALPLLTAIGAEGLEPENGELPSGVIALAAFVRNHESATAQGSNVVTVPGRDGLVTLHASKPDAGGERVAIVIEAASGPRAATVRLEAHGATVREREVATLIARGLTNAEIAGALVLSPHTVADHAKSLFEKMGVASRQELVARVFLDEYLPDVIQKTPLTSHGRFEAEAM
ncbi:MAG TPA: LuxR C-terminal-related transcriptional regulator [Solirubrobacterales bacterium]|jgi:DNA-binding CsgD family transcriptional regulator|nr:LuxR C-terminal-related transcriptional regulator [Solirubrobacterales bacterium]